MSVCVCGGGGGACARAVRACVRLCVYVCVWRGVSVGGV